MSYDKDELLMMLDDVESIVQNAPDDSVFDIIETYENVTVEVLKNSKTGEVSIGWHYGKPKDQPFNGRSFYDDKRRIC